MPETAPARADRARFRANLQDERDAIFLYTRLAAAERDPGVAAVYRRLADTERKHAAVWAEKLRAAGEDLPPDRVSARAHLLAWLADRFGAGAVLPIVMRQESAARLGYDDQPDAKALGMPQDERSHARIFTQLSRFSATGLGGPAVAQLEGRHRSAGGNALRAAVLGWNDGLCSNLALIMGVAGASAIGDSVVVAGGAGLLAGALSMALGEWLSVQSARELYAHQLRIERDELAVSPEVEREELALIYQAKGVPEAEAQALADQIMANPDSALETLAREELSIDPDELGGSAWQAAATSFLLFAAGAIIPLLGFLLFTGVTALVVSLVASVIGLFATGAAITLFTGRGILYSGGRQVLFGMATAGITFAVGRLVGVSLGG